jgi:hypothetical protein
MSSGPAATRVANTAAAAQAADTATQITILFMLSSVADER